MRIVMITLGGIFTEGMTYQDNLLANQLKDDGNDVTVIATCYTYKNGKCIEVKEEDSVLDNGIRLIRMKYKNILGNFISKKIRMVKGLYSFLEENKPDIVFFHGIQSFDLYSVSRYIKYHPSVKLYVDNHADYYNSAKNCLSKHVLHKIFYKMIIQKSLPYINKVFCVSYESHEFAIDVYDVPVDKSELYPLGGVVLDEDSRNEKRRMVRYKLGLKNEDILMVHSGKMDSLKQTEEVLKAFRRTPSDRLHLVLIGSLSDKISENVGRLMLTDKRIKYLGWKKGDKLIEYLCACDLYVQPGSQSVTMQNAACCKSALALYPYKSHKYLLKDSVFYIKNENDMIRLFRNIAANPLIIEQKRQLSYKVAIEKLDYKILARRLHQTI